MLHKLQCPYFHLTKTLTTELCFTTKRLLRDKTVRSDRTGMHLIINHMVKFDHINNSHGCFLVETVSRFAIKQVSMTHHRDTGFSTIVCDLISSSPVEDWCSEFHPEFLTGPAKNGFIDLSQVHTARHAQRIQYDINRCPIFQERHVFMTNDLGNDTFVTMTTRHLISHFQLTFYSEINFCKLQHSCRQLITNTDVEFLSLITTQLFIELDIVVMQKRIDLLINF